MTGTALARSAPMMSDNEINSSFRIARALASSGLFKDASQAEQAFAKILLGRDLGLSPTVAMTNINIVQGKPELSANLQAALVRSTPGYDYRVRKLDDAECVIEFFRNGELLGESTFTMGDAAQAGLAGKPIWKQYPRNMLFARAMSNGVAFHCPEVTGGLRVYSEGELDGDSQKVPTPPVYAVNEPQAEALPSDVPVPAEWPVPSPEPAAVIEAAAEEVPADPMAETVDPAFANDILDEFKRKQVNVGQRRELFEQIGVDPGENDLRSGEKLLALIVTLTVAQAVELTRALADLPEPKAVAA